MYIDGNTDTWIVNEGTYTQDGTWIYFNATRTISCLYDGVTVEPYSETSTYYLVGDVMKADTGSGAEVDMVRGSTTGIWWFGRDLTSIPTPTY